MAGTPEEVVQEHTQVKWNIFREGASTALQTSASETPTFKNIEAVSCGSGAAWGHRLETVGAWSVVNLINAQLRVSMLQAALTPGKQYGNSSVHTKLPFQKVPQFFFHDWLSVGAEFYVFWITVSGWTLALSSAPQSTLYVYPAYPIPGLWN